MKIAQFGTSFHGLPIMGYHFGTQGPHVLILGGVHGDEPEGIAAAWGLLNSFLVDFPYRLNVTIVPQFNMDGSLTARRQNGNNVDLNRNLPTSDWSPKILNPRYPPGKSPGSESETQALTQFISDNKLRWILSLHSWKPVLNINGKCRKEAEVIQKMTGYDITEDIGYPTPGCLGTYTGLEREIPTMTYEIERGLELSQVLKIHVPAILESLKVCEMEQ